MKKKIFFPGQLIIISFSIFLFSCNDSAEKKEDAAETAADSATTTAAAPTPSAFEPFDLMEISHKVKDYDKWRPLFNEDSTVRRANGMQELVVGRNIDDPNQVSIVLQLSDLQKARDFGADPRLKQVMDKAGVISKPDVQFFRILRFNPNSKETSWVRVTHRVKDFEAWLKVYDSEGTAGRASQGLIDMALGRGIEDPNIVTLTFDIRDIEKAKASIFSEEKKKLMASAGVEGVPKIEFFKLAE